MNDFIPRRSRIDQMSPEEKSLFDMVGQIEALGAHPLLTDCVVLLGEARSKLSDWVDMSRPTPDQADGATGEELCSACSHPKKLHSGDYAPNNPCFGDGGLCDCWDFQEAPPLI